MPASSDRDPAAKDALLRRATVEEPPDSAAAPDECCGLLRNLGAPDPRRRYVRISEIASGGSAQIFKVWDNNLGRLVAEKVAKRSLPPGGDICLHRSEDVRVARFVGEANVMSHLNHPGVVPVHELGINAEGRLYFTMQLIHGETFESVLAKVAAGLDDWSLPRALGVLVRVCETLGFAHGRGIVHRDVKPTNVMVGRYGEVYVMDWGLSHVTGAPSSEMPSPGAETPAHIVLCHARRHETPRGVLLGTPYYMPVEQAEGKQAGRAPQVDIYAVGAMLYQVLSGRAPYSEIHRGLGSLLAALRDGPPAPLPTEVPAELAAICDKAMARDPADRYEDMKAMEDDLRAYLEHRTVHAAHTGWARRLGKWCERNPSRAVWCAAAVTSFFLFASTALYVLLR